MENKVLKQILTELAQNKISVESALEKLKSFPVDDMDFVKLDSHRQLRKGFPEVVYCKNKTEQQIMEIFKKMCLHHDNFLFSRLEKNIAEKIKKLDKNVKHHENAGLLVREKNPLPKKRGNVLVVTAGTSDIGIAEEAAYTASIMGHKVETCFDVGVAGIHRLFAITDKLKNASVIIVVAGMEGALPSVISGLVDVPVIAVPTSVGYGVHLSGITPLLGMLSSCSPGIAVVNIDNGFGAGYFAALVNQTHQKD